MNTIKEKKNEIILGYSNNILCSLIYLEKQLEYIERIYTLKMDKEKYTTIINKLKVSRILSDTFTIVYYFYHWKLDTPIYNYSFVYITTSKGLS